MELGTEIGQKLKKTIKKQLQTLGSYVDDELPEYIMVMIANKRTKLQMVEDLHLFLNDDAQKFVNWLLTVLAKIKQAMKLPDLDDSNEDDDKDEDAVSATDPETLEEDYNSDEEQPEKTKKGKKGSNLDEDTTRKKEDERGKVRRFKENGSDSKMKQRSSSKDKKLSSSESPERRRSRSKARRSSTGKEHSRSRSKSPGRSRKKSLRTWSSDRRRSQSRGRRRFPSRERRHWHSRSRKRSQSKRRYSRSFSKDRISRPLLTSISRRSRSEERKQIDKRQDSIGSKDDDPRVSRRNPMEDVKRIAKDINHRLAGGKVLGNDKVVDKDYKDEEVDINIKGVQIRVKGEELTCEQQVKDNKVVHISSENVSLKAVGQYGDGDANENEKTSKSSLDKIEKYHHGNKSTRNRSRSRSPRRRTTIGHRRHRSRSKSISIRRRRNSRSRSTDKKLDNNQKRRSPYRSNRQQSFIERNHRDSKGSRSHSDSRNERNGNEEIKENEKAKKKEEKATSEEKVASQVKVVLDDRKSRLEKTHQATSALLKKAMCEAVSETKQQSNPGEEGIELDYNEEDDIAENTNAEKVAEEDATKCGDRRVINIDHSAAITVSFKSANESTNNEDDDEDEWEEKPSKHKIDVAEKKSRKGHGDKEDARYAIMKSRHEQHGQKERTAFKENTKKEPPPKKRFLGSMIADLEEKTTNDLKRRQRIERRQNRERLLQSNRINRGGKQRSPERLCQQQHKQQRPHRSHSGNRRASSDEEVLSAEQVQKLTEESRRMKVQELTRTINSAQEGDLRNLLKQRKSVGERGDSVLKKEQSNSDNEDVLEHKLREKVKEEKHLRLFGKLNRGERTRIQHETENLRKRLQRARKKRREKDERHSRRRDSKDAKSDHEKRLTSPKAMKEDVKIDHEENADDDENDEWVESGNANIEGDTDEEDDEKVLQENKEEEEDIGDKSKDASPSNNADEGPEDNSSNSRKVVTEEEDDEAEETQEDVQIEGDVEDTSVVKVTKDVLLASVHKEDVGDGDGVGNVGGGQEEDNNEDEEPPKRKKTRQEFIVTLDGFERKSTTASRSTTSRRRSDRNTTTTTNTDRKGSSSLTQSDEEFERILQKKENEERSQKQQQQMADDEQRSQRSSRRSSSHYHNNHHRSSHHHQRNRSGGGRRYGRSRSPPSDDGVDNKVDREIMMAEQRLKAQKLLQKSLDQVQSLNTESYAAATVSKKTKTTAFVNPHFKPKVDLPVMNVLPLNVAGKPLAAAGSINHHRMPTAADATLQQFGATTLILPGATPVMLPQRPLQSKVILSPMVTSPTVVFDAAANARKFVLQNSGDGTVTSNEENTLSSQAQEVTVVQPKEATQHMVAPPQVLPAPAVKLDTATKKTNNTTHQPIPSKSHIHCTTFPNCNFGDRCMYMHPACKFGDRCTNMHCVFSHNNSTVSSVSSTLCKFHPNCMKIGCPYKHPVAKSCRFGANCTNADCLYTHDTTTSPTTTNVSDKIWIAPKSHISDRRFAVEGEVVSNPVSIAVSTTPPTTTPPTTATPTTTTTEL